MHYTYDAWFLHKTLNELLNSIYEDYDYVLIDRGLYDRLIFNEICYHRKQYAETRYVNTKNYIKEFTELENNIFLFMLSPEQAISRRKDKKPGRVMNLEVLAIFHNIFDKFSSEIPNLHIIDASQSIDEITKEILDDI